MGNIEFPASATGTCTRACHKTVAYPGMPSPGSGSNCPGISALRHVPLPMKTATDPSTDPTPDPDGSGILLKPAKGSILRKLGAGSLAISLLIHAVIIAIGIFLVIAVIPPEPEKTVDFKPGGGGGGSPASSPSQKKMHASIAKPNTARVAAANVTTAFTLPEPTSTSSMSSLGALGGSMGTGGMGGAGSGGGSGNGTGMGTGDGMGMGSGMAGGKGLIVFGTTLNVRSIGVVLDVSGSMTRHLPKVIHELDRVAKGSPVVLHVGCGISGGKTRPNIDAVVSPMRRGGGEEPFKRFWYLYQDPFYRDERKDSRTKVDFSRPLPVPEVYKVFASRQNTYYNDPEGPKSTADAILAREFDKVDAIYWFADFQDRIDEEQAGEILKTLKRRKQKLYMHASAQGQYIDVARNLICIPSGGKEIQPDAAPSKSVKN